jgi:hypothetical protein
MGTDGSNPRLEIPMTRILPTLASCSLMLLGAALVIGLTVGDLYAEPSAEMLNWVTVHRLTGVSAALVVVLVESVIVTYFIGTSRWCREVVETYRLDPALARNSSRLKRRTFPWALAGMLAVVGIIALGGAADPSNTLQIDTAAWATWHLAGAILGILLIAWTYVAAWNNVHANQSVIEEIVAQVARVRRERGLDGTESRHFGASLPTDAHVPETP